jgi:hypothetical protein
VELSTGEFRQEEFSFAPRDLHGETSVVRSAPSPELLDRMVAALQAELGSSVCSHILIVPGRFPEDRFALVPISHGRQLLSRSHSARIPEGRSAFRVRRILTSDTPKRAPAYPGPRRSGPFLLSSAWWEGVSEDRVYEYRVQPDGREAWMYRVRSGSPNIRGQPRFYLQGYLE